MKIKEHRCPWCGSITDPLRLRTEMMKKCCNCGNKYTYHKDGFIGKVYNVLWILTCACGLLAMVNICIAMIIVCLLLIITFSTYNFMSYERVNDNKNFTYKKYKAKLEFTKNELNYIKRRYFLQDKSIIPICFVNDEKNAISHMICICIENTQKVTNIEFECIFSFLPLSDVTYDVKKNNINFFFYKDYKKIGEAVLLNQIDNS